MPETERRTSAATDGPVTPATESLAGNIAAAKSFLAYYISAKLDRLMLVVKNIVVFSLLGIVASIVAVTVLVTATIYLCVGIVGGLEAVFGRFAWAAPLLFGFVVLFTIALGGFVFLKRVTGGSKERLVTAYERRQRQQRSEFGTDVHGEAGGNVN